MKLYCDVLTGASPMPIERVVSDKIQAIQSTPNMALEHVLFKRLDALTSIVADVVAAQPKGTRDEIAKRLGFKPAEQVSVPSWAANTLPPNTTPPPRVVMVVSGGVVQTVNINQPGIEVEVIDCDNLRAEGKSEDEIEAEINTAISNTPLTVVGY